MENFKEFVSLWKSETKNIPTRNLTQLLIRNYKLLYLVVYPDNLEWNFSVEKQTQTTTLMVSGGYTGAGIGHFVDFCYRSGVYDYLKNCTHTHAMIVSVGMVFDMVKTVAGKPVTPISDFIDFVNSEEYCKAHIMAKKDKPAYLHHQHINLNVDMWKTIGSPPLDERWTEYERGNENYHDDYTPSWIKPKGRPKIINFSHAERTRKAFSYYREYNEVWKDLEKADRDDFYFSRFMTRIQKSFYMFNTESLKEVPDENFDIIFSPTAGYRGETNCSKLGVDHIVFYDYTQANIDLKKQIVEMNMSLEEIYMLKEVSDEIMVGNRNNSPSANRVLGMGSFDELRKMQAEMFERCEIDYWLMDIINPDYNKLAEKVKDKIVLFDTSNIFSYHMSHAYYTLDELVNAYNKLHQILIESSNMCWFQGTRPTKQWNRKWI
tara:strand:+ start:479 stop:1780 length:1302 start_codon:yes stop_codon:yes gene_type:complete